MGLTHPRTRWELSVVKKPETAGVPALWSPLDAMQNPLTQEGKSRFAVHHAFDELDPGHMPFHLSVIDLKS